MKATIPFLLIVAVLSAHGRIQDESAPPKSMAIIAYDSGDSSSPSQRDSRWAVTNSVQIAKLHGYIRNAKHWGPNKPIPECLPAGCVETVSHTGRTNLIHIVHIHGKVSSITIVKRGGRFSITDGAGFMNSLASIGVDTNKFFAGYWKTTEHPGAP